MNDQFHSDGESDCYAIHFIFCVDKMVGKVNFSREDRSIDIN